MLATEFFFSQTFSSGTSYKRTKSQQKSTHAKYKKNPSFVHPSSFPEDAMFLSKLAVLQLCFTKISFLIVFNICNFQKSIINRRINVSVHYWN